MITAIVTMPPYAPYIDEVLKHPIVSGIRLNTVMPVKKSDTLSDLVSRLHDMSERRGKRLYIDLKCRQLRVKTYGVPPFTEIELTHNISVNTPTKAYFHDGRESATVLSAEGNRLIMLEGPKSVVGPGESINILDPSLIVDGYFTEKDEGYIAAGLKAGCHRYMLSFVEQQEDIDLLREKDHDARPIAKIESQKGLEFVRRAYDWKARLMAARGDLYVELQKPHEIITAEEDILRKDKHAIVASRIFPSLSDSLEPSCEDINGVDNLLRMGYRTLMLGDDICQERDSCISALNLLEALAARYEKHSKILPVSLYS
jgi:pyruvate kinase